MKPGTGIAGLLVVGLLAFSCSDAGDGESPTGVAGAGGAEDEQGGASSGGKSTRPNAGAAGEQGDAGHAGQGAAASSSGVSGEGGGGRGGAPAGGEAGEGGAAGPSEAEACYPPRCFVGGECSAEQTCDGAPSSALVCVPERAYCDDDLPCVQPAAGCVNHRCLPPLVTDAACSKSSQCASSQCVKGKCGYGSECCLSATDCAEGFACSYNPHGVCAIGPSTGGPSTCRPVVAELNELCNGRDCRAGLQCSSLYGGDNLPRCTGPRRNLGNPCSTYGGILGDPDVVWDCVDGLYCPAPPIGTATCKQGQEIFCPTSCKQRPRLGEDCSDKDTLGKPVLCEAGAYCGADKLCHAAYGADCATTPCSSGFRCAASVRGGRCAGAAPFDQPVATSMKGEQFLKASDADNLANWGTSVALSGTTLVVGAPYWRSGPVDTRVGAAYVLTQQSGVWSEQAILHTDTPGQYASFGRSVAIEGDTMAVGSAVGAHVFVRTNGTWTQQAHLTSPKDAASVALSGDTLAVGSWAESSKATGIDGDSTDTSASWAGAVFVYVRSGASWTRQAYVKASNTRANAYFGISVALDGDNLAVGASGENSKGVGVGGDQSGRTDFKSNGAAYVFARSGVTWSQKAFIKAPTQPAEGSPDFGSSIALAQDISVVGDAEDTSSASGIDGADSGQFLDRAGAAYIFQREGQSWTQQAYVKAPSPHAREALGVSAATDGTFVVVGARTAPDGLGFGRVHLLERVGQTWQFRSHLRGSDQKNAFGTSVSLSGGLLAVGAPLDMSRPGQDDRCDSFLDQSGAVFVGEY